MVETIDWYGKDADDIYEYFDNLQLPENIYYT